MKTTFFAVAAVLSCVAACGSSTEGVSAGVDTNGVSPLGQKGCNKHVDCDDGNPCTADTCVHGRGCQYASAPNGTACSDGNACTTGDACVAGACAGAPVVCTAADQCHAAGVCEPATGACPVMAPTKTDGAACDDHNACTSQDTCVAGICGTPQAGKYTFEEISYPGAANTYGVGINAFGDVVGEYQSTTDYAVHAFTLHAGTYTSIDRPGSTDTYVAAIDDAGRVLGFTSTPDGQHPFIYANGVFSVLTGLEGDVNIPTGWNAAGDIVGVVGAQSFLFHAGVRTLLNIPGADITGVSGINAAGDIVGSGVKVGDGGAITDMRGFVLRGGSWSSFAVPGAVTTGATGISGDAVVGSLMAADNERHTFVYRNAAFMTVDVPGAPSTYGQGINATGQVVGTFDKGAFRISTAFVATPTANACVTP
jgi:hypothetical protein